MWSNLEYIICCVCCYGDDETAIFFYFDISCIPYFIYKMRIDKKKKKKEKKVEIIQSHPFSKNRFDNGPHIEDFWSTLSLWRKKRLGWTDYDFWWWFQFMCNVPYAFNHCLCVWVCDPYVCPTGLIAWCIKDYIMIFWCTLVSSIITYYNKKKNVYI